MAGSEAPLEQRVYGIMQFLLAHYANRRTPESPAPRGIVAEQDALDAVLQVAAVIDEYTQSGAIPVQRGVHAGAMLMVACDYIRPLPPGISRDGTDRLTADLQELVNALRAVRNDRRSSG
jgi:hypothetical protein